MMGDVPFGAYLSGGVDSSAITILMNDLMNKPIDTFTVSFKNEPDFDESRYAKQISKRYQANYHEIKISKNDLKKFFDKLIFHQDEPLADWVCFPLYYASKLIKDNGVIVAQVGEGSDELFAGYDGYLQFVSLNKYYEVLKKMPKLIRYCLYRISAFIYNLWPWRFLVEFFRRAYHEEELFWGGAIAFSEFEKTKLLTKKLKNRYNSHNIIKKIYNKFDSKFPHRDYLDRMTYLELKNRLAELLLMRIDKISAAVSIETRVPFLDHKFVTKMLAIPENIKISQGTKTIFKKSLQGTVPHNIIYRQKRGFAAPIAKWLKEPRFGKFIMNKIINSKLIEEDLLNTDYIKKIYSYHKQGKADFSVQLWTLANLCAWYDYWIAKKNYKKIK